MKKKIILVLISLFSILPMKVIGLENDSYIDWNLDRTVFVHQYKDGKETIENLAMIAANGKTAYCIEPGVMADKASYYNSTTNIKDTPLNGKDIKKLTLIGYYGYGYDNHNTKEYYMASQELIWELMGVEDVWWTDAKYNGNILDIEGYKNEILKLVDNYEKAPMFNFLNKYIVGDEITVSDAYKVLEGYELESDNKNISINGNDLTIKVSTDNRFKLSRKQTGQSPIFYYKSGYQTIGSFEGAYEFSKEYNINHGYAKITLEKYDYDTKSKTPFIKEATLEGATYGLYDVNKNLLLSKTTDKEGKIVFDNLEKGIYSVIEIKPSYGYSIDTYDRQTYVDSKRQEVVLESYEKIIRNRLTVSKFYDTEENDILIPEENIEFGIYDEKNNLYGKYKTNRDGNFFVELPFGTYTLKQLTTKEGINKVEDRIIVVNESNKSHKLILVNKKIKEEIIEEPEEIIPEEPKEELPEEIVPEENKEEIIPEIIEEEKLEELPNTSKSYSISIYLLISALFYILFKYEKKIN